VAILPIKGAELAGPLPSELQNVIIYAAGVASCAPEPVAAQAFLGFMATPDAIRLIRAKGLEPG
jgi:molybdate transport system substrate-binding protein